MSHKLWRQNYTLGKEEKISKKEEIASHFNKYFNDITKRVTIKRWHSPNLLYEDPLVNGIRKHASFKPSILFDFNIVTVLALPK